MLDRKSLKFSSSYKCPANVEGGFWRSKQLIFITKDLTLHSLDGSNFVNYDGGNEETEMEEETAEMKEVQGYSELDIFNLNAKWVGREAVRSKKRMESTINRVHLLADCNSALDELAKSMLI